MKTLLRVFLLLSCLAHAVCFKLLKFLFTYTSSISTSRLFSTRIQRATSFTNLSLSIALLFHMRIVSRHTKVSCCVLLILLIQRKRHSREQYEGHGLKLHQVQKSEIGELFFPFFLAQNCFYFMMKLKFGAF